MRRIHILSFIVTAVICSASSVIAGEYHGDSAPSYLMNDTILWFDITSDHDGFCDNLSTTNQAYPDIDCWEFSTRTQRNVNQDCGSGACSMSATVHCPNLGLYGDHYLTFSCHTVPGGGLGVRGGVLGNNPMKKGVECGDISCGCVYACYSGVCGFQFFGSMQSLDNTGKSWSCNVD